jgi:hypothetical protein
MTGRAIPVPIALRQAGDASEKAYLIQLGLGLCNFCNRIRRGVAEEPGFKIKKRRNIVAFLQQILPIPFCPSKQSVVLLNKCNISCN